MSRITYSDDFKREAVRLVTDEGVSRKQAARDLGVSVGTLRDWIHQLAPGKTIVSDALTDAEQLRQYKREIERVTMERELLNNIRLHLLSDAPAAMFYALIRRHESQFPAAIYSGYLV